MAVSFVYGQEIPLGTWRTHFSFDRVLLTEETPNFIFAAADVGLFAANKVSGEVRKYSTLDGLQGVDISALAYDQGSQSLYIAYSSGNLDILTGSDIVNLDLTTSSQIIGSRAINAIIFDGSRIFLATDYGILDFDGNTREVRGTYRELGEEASQLGVTDLALSGDSLFAVTEKGWQVASAIGTGMADYRNWRRVAIPGGLDHVVALGANVFFQSAPAIYVYREHVFTLFADDGGYRGVADAAGRLAVIRTDEIVFYTADGQLGESVSDVTFRTINDFLKDENGIGWVADDFNGLLKDSGGFWQSLSPTGPVRSEMFALSYSLPEVLAFTGGISVGGIPLGREGSYSAFESGTWGNTNIPGFGDVVMGIRWNGDTYLASAGDGIYRTGESGNIIFDSGNSPMTANSRGDVLVTDLKDRGDLLFALNHDSPTPLLSYDGQAWQVFNGIPPIGRYGIELEFAGPVFWMRILPSRGGGILGVIPESSQSRYLNEQPDEGSLTSRNVFDLEKDREGFLWIGTDRGVSVLFNPNTIEGPVNAVEPVFDGRPLLVDREVYVIKADGGNRKWMGTDQGAWLFDPLADNLLIHFTSANSPIPSDQVRDITIDDQTGEVFFLTDAGIASYRAAATAGDRAHGDVRIFPNPVRREFQGTVGISGLTQDAFIRITDVAGRLIYQTRANGGTASWPVRESRDLNTGMYLVFSASEDGEESYIGKIAVIN